MPPHRGRGGGGRGRGVEGRPVVVSAGSVEAGGGTGAGRRCGACVRGDANDDAEIDRRDANCLTDFCTSCVNFFIMIGTSCVNLLSIF